jgi:hypothetical protein
VRLELVGGWRSFGVWREGEKEPNFAEAAVSKLGKALWRHNRLLDFRLVGIIVAVVAHSTHH